MSNYAGHRRRLHLLTPNATKETKQTAQTKETNPRLSPFLSTICHQLFSPERRSDFGL